MTKQKNTVTSSLNYKTLNAHFSSDKKYDVDNGMKGFGSYSVSVLNFVKGKVIETSFLTFFVDSDGGKKSPCDFGQCARDHELKFHISLPEWDRATFQKGCDIIISTLIGEKIDGFKMVRAHDRLSLQVGQEGKDVTIYAKFNVHMSLEKWTALFKKITDRLVKAHVSPGYKVLGSYIRTLSDYDSFKDELKGKRIPPERAINSYIYYRYDKQWPQEDRVQGIKVKVRPGMFAKHFENVEEALKPRAQEELKMSVKR